jgi:hypothetical protein
MGDGVLFGKALDIGGVADEEHLDEVVKVVFAAAKAFILGVGEYRFRCGNGGGVIRTDMLAGT